MNREEALIMAAEREGWAMIARAKDMPGSAKEFELTAKLLRFYAMEEVGKWLSAALEDPLVCAEMKADINTWFKGIEE